MPEEQLAALADVLVQHTTTPDDCWFGFWEGRAGHGMNLPHPGPRVHIPSRKNYLARGTVGDAVRTLGSCGPDLW
ncbi:hypothetical protein MPY17_27830 [Rhodococcus opacus]|uniref:hypothetical protein n=1 Tax=Rhodococcus opacus TaxID=37919 RepID=UPI001FF4022E|nr:hypothetical protein [Rhodococcus opacus]UOT02741.1 hypothetical protein MPY17_27830 [Rhodococcus opacus]